MSKRLLLERKEEGIYAFKYGGNNEEFEEWCKSIGAQPDICEPTLEEEEEVETTPQLSIMTANDLSDEVYGYFGTEVYIGDYIIYDSWLGWDVRNLENLQKRYKILKPLGMKIERKKKGMFAFKYKGNYEEFKQWVISIGVTTPLTAFSNYDEEDNYLHIITYLDEQDDYRACYGTDVAVGCYIVYEENLGWNVLYEREFREMYKVLKR